MNIKDFKESDLFTFESKCDMWDEKGIWFSVDFPEGPDNAKKELLAAHIADIEKHIQWINSHRADIEQCLIDDGMVSLAEDWAAGAEEAEDQDGECYIMEDGETVCLPIAEANFRKSLAVGEFNISFFHGWDSPQLELFLQCTPDYFAGHSIIVDVDKDGQCTCGSLAG